jgi:hypothetical protein
MPQPLEPQERALLPIEYEDGWTTNPVWMIRRREISLAPAEFQKPNHPVCSFVTIPTTLF